MLDSIENARYQTFQGDLESKLAKNLVKLTNDTPITKLVVPFVKTPVNIIKQGVGERSPLALLRPKFWQTVKAGGREANNAMLRVALGTTAVGMVWQWADDGNMTGSRVGRGASKNSADIANIPPYSIKVNGQWMQYNRLDPIGTVLGLTVDLKNYIHDRHDRLANESELDDPVAGEMFSNLLMITTENLTDKTFFKGITDFVEAVDAGASGGGSTGSAYVTSLATNLMPFSALVRNIAKSEDDYSRLAFSFSDKVLAQTPGASGSLAVNRDVLGRPLENVGRIGPDWMSPFLVGKDDKDPVAVAFASLEMNYRMPDKDIAGVKLTPQAYSRLLEVRGQYVYDQLKEFIDEGDWQDLTKQQRLDKLERWMSTGTSNAKEAVRNEFPEIGNLIEHRMDQVRQLKTGEIQ